MFRQKIQNSVYVWKLSIVWMLHFIRKSAYAKHFTSFIFWLSWNYHLIIILQIGTGILPFLTKLSGVTWRLRMWGGEGVSGAKGWVTEAVDRWRAVWPNDITHITALINNIWQSVIPQWTFLQCLNEILLGSLGKHSVNSTLRPHQDSEKVEGRKVAKKLNISFFTDSG